MLKFKDTSNVDSIKTHVYSTSFMSPSSEGCDHDEDTLDKSIIDISECNEGAPIILSKPHFYGGPTSLLSLIDGLNPNEADHDIRIEVDPLTGLIVKAINRIQFNIHLKPINGIRLVIFKKKLLYCK